MSNRPRTFREMREAGELRLRSKVDALANIDAEALVLQAKLDAMASPSILEPRKPGRPAFNQPRRVTEVRSLRLEKCLWERLEELAEHEGCSINRFIEESIVERVMAPTYLFPAIPLLRVPGAWGIGTKTESGSYASEQRTPITYDRAQVPA